MEIKKKILFIIESPGKIKKLNQILGSEYIVKASVGHVLNLNPKKLSIDLKSMEPEYIFIDKNKKQIISEFKKISKNSSKICIATDSDREGEAIAEQIRDLMNIGTNYERIIFNEITEKCINNAINNPLKINLNLFYSQKARRVLDRLVGYLISPIIPKNNSLTGIYSAGRVQSAALYIIVNKENEISDKLNNNEITENDDEEKKINSISTNNNNYYNINGNFTIKKNDISNAKWIDINNNNIDKQYVMNMYNMILKNNNFVWKIFDIDEYNTFKNPKYPFTTSTLQQEAFNVLNFDSKKTMRLAQQLYENGHITYIRTDNHNLSKEALYKIRQYIINNYGEDLYKQRSIFKNIKESPHEAIRPTQINIDKLNNDDNGKLYNLIWKQTIASQMIDAEYYNKKIKIILVDKKYEREVNNKSFGDKPILGGYFEQIISMIKNPGFLILYNSKYIKNELNNLFNVNDVLDNNSIIALQNTPSIPKRFNDSKLIKILEKYNIGRPSTYSSIIEKLKTNNHIEIKKNIEGKKFKINELLLKNNDIIEKYNDVVLGSETNKMVPTKLGIFINNFLQKNFKNFFNLEFTASVEANLDEIANGKLEYYTVIKKYYDNLLSFLGNINLNVYYTPTSNKKQIDKIYCIHKKYNKNIYITETRYGKALMLDYKINNKNIYISLKKINLKSLNEEKVINMIDNKINKLINKK